MIEPEKTAPWPADKVERRALSSLVPYARNSRTHGPPRRRSGAN